MRLIFRLAFAVTLAAPLAAVAEPTATVEVTVVQASNEDGPTDARLGSIKDQFRNLSFKSYKVLSQQRVDVKQGGTQDVALPDGKKLAIAFTGRDHDGNAVLKLDVPGTVSLTAAMPVGKVTNVAVPRGAETLFVPVKLVAVK